MTDAGAGSASVDRRRQPTQAEWAIITRQFDRLAKLPPADQIARLRRAKLDGFMAAQIERLLAASRDAGVLDRQLERVVSAADDIGDIAPGTVIDGFSIQRRIGRGGAGDVFLATRVKDRFTQRVALKLLRQNAVKDSAAFAAERALVAGLDHPNIARLVDGGAGPDGRPYMALDFVEGDPITDWCHSHHAGLEQRLRLFLQVCDAVSYAHARLIVHNDIKPGNILIDRLGHARLLDFGIARVIEKDQGPAGPAASFMLTPGYAAPEQLAGDRTTTATDVYALGALLFEMLVGRTPWKSSRAAVPTILRRMIDDLPVFPSRAGRVGTDMPFSPRKLAGDLDAIVLKAMQDQPAHRYHTVDALAEDVGRFLRHDPVSARSASFRYRCWRFAQRHRWPLGAGTVAALALIIASTGIAWQAHRTAIERDVARDRATRFEAANQALLMMFRDAGDSDRLEKTSVANMVQDTTRRMVESLPPDSPNAAPMIAALADIYLITENNTDAMTLLSGALRRGIGRDDPVNEARLKLKLGTLLTMEGRFVDATSLLDEADRVWRGEPDRYLRESVETVGARALMAKLQDRPQDAIRLLVDDMPSAVTVYANDDRDYAARVASLASLYADVGKLDAAVTLLHQTRDAMASPGRPPSGPSLTIARLEADMLSRSGKAERATVALRDVIARRRRYYGPSIALAVDLLYLARILNVLDQPSRALAALGEAEPMAVDHFGSYSQPVVQIRLAQVEALARLGRVKEATAMFASINPVASRLTGGGVSAVRYLRVKALLAGVSGDRAGALRQITATRDLAEKLGRSGDALIPELTATRDVVLRSAGSRKLTVSNAR